MLSLIVSDITNSFLTFVSNIRLWLQLALQDDELSYLVYTFWTALSVGTDSQVLSAALNKAIELGDAVVSQIDP